MKDLLSLLLRLLTWIKVKLKKRPDSTYSVTRKYYDMRREPLVARSIRVDPEQWKDFVEFCRERKTSTCFEIRSFIDARLGGEAMVTARQPLTVHQTVIYEVDRPRRKAVLPESDVKVRIEYFGSGEKCGFCDREPVVLGYVWVSDTLCNAMYLCGSHDSYHKEKYGSRYSFREL